MATTTNYAWETPDDTDLVKDGAAAIRTLGSSIDTTTKALNPSTTEGDIEYRSATANTNSRLAIGTAGQVLTVNSGADAPEWAALPASASGLTLISATACAAVSSQSVTGFSATYNNYKIIFSGDGSVNDSVFMKLRLGAVDSSTAYYGFTNRYFSNAGTQTATYVNGTSGVEVSQSMTASVSVIDVLRPYEAKRTSIIAAGTHFNTGNSVSSSIWTSGIHNLETSYDGFTLNWFTSSFTGTIYLYGYQAA